MFGIGGSILYKMKEHVDIKEKAAFASLKYNQNVLAQRCSMIYCARIRLQLDLLFYVCSTGRTSLKIQLVCRVSDLCSSVVLYCVQ